MTDQPLGGTFAGRYRIMAPLGHGALSVVYRAFDSVTNRVVALKTIPTTASAAPQLLQEAAALSKLNHPGIVQIYDSGESDGLVYLALEFVDGESLAAVLTRERSLEARAAVAIAREATRALEHAHERSVLHRDFKPSNILISRDGRVLLSDFGIAGAPGAPTRGPSGKVMGTPRYMSPEQAMGEFEDARSDVFAVGAVLYETLSGVPAFPGQSAPSAQRLVVEQDPVPLHKRDVHIPRSLSRVVTRALAKNPDLRFQSAHELLRAIDATGLAVSAVGILSALVRPPAGTNSGIAASDTAPAPTGSAFSRWSVARRLRHEAGTFFQRWRRFQVRRPRPSNASRGSHAENHQPVTTIPTDEDPTLSLLPYVRDFEALWNQMLIAAEQQDKESFVRLAERIVQDFLREAIGYRIERAVPYFRGTVGWMVDAPLLWIRYSRFPILFVAFNPSEPSVLPVVVKQLEIAGAAEFFAILIVVPTNADGTGNEAEELRSQVSGSVFRHDFVVLDGRRLATIIEEGTTQQLVEVILRQGVGLYSLSPYVVNGPVPERMFFGREQEVKAVSQNIVDHDYVVLGGRRIGKSSILLRLHGLLNSDPRFCAVYNNCEDKADPREFLEELASEHGLELDSSDPRAFRQLVAAIRQHADSKRVVFLLDEVDELLARDAETSNGLRLFKAFRSLSHQGDCRFVFSGSRTVFSHLADPRSPFFNFCEALVLRPLDAKSVAEIVAKPMRQLGIAIVQEERFIQRFLELTSSHPNITQWMCDKVVRNAFESLGAGVPAILDQLTEALRSSRRATITDLDTLAASREFQEYYVSTAWGDALPIERLISLVVPGPSFTARDVQDRLVPYGIKDARLVDESLKILELYSLVERRGGEYAFRLAAFPQLVRDFDGFEWQLEHALSELTRRGHGHNRWPG